MSHGPHHRSIHAYVHQGRVGVLVEIGTETQIVATEPTFVAIAHDIALQVAAQNPSSVEELLDQPSIKDPTVQISLVLSRASERFGERIRITRILRWDTEQPLSAGPPKSPDPPKGPAVVMAMPRK